MADKREFTGVFIPAHIWTSKELIPSEKMLLGEIDCLSKSRGYCDASRAHFAEWLSCTVQNITYYFNRLEQLGFIQIDKTPGFRSKIRLINARFYVESPAGGGKRDLRVGVNGTDGGGKRDLPEIQEERKDEIQDIMSESENSDVTFQVTTVEQITIPLEATPKSEKPSPTVPAPRVKIKEPTPDPVPKRDNNDPRPHLKARIENERRQWRYLKATEKHKEADVLSKRGIEMGAEYIVEANIDTVVHRLNEKGNFPRGYRTDKKETRTAIRKRLKEYSVDDLYTVVDFKCKEWKDDAKLRQYLRPDTLFNGHFEDYLNAALLDKQSPLAPKGQVEITSSLPSNLERYGR